LKEQQKLKSQISFYPTPKSPKYPKGTFSRYNGIGTHLIYFYFLLILFGKFLSSKSKLNLLTQI